MTSALPSLNASAFAEFPVHGLLPKYETESLQFVREHPTYDGRGVKVAILDTGIDPAAAGMQVCPDGSRKVIDLIDCTGSGDVDTATAVKPVLGGRGDRIRALSGAEIVLNPKWKNPSGEWRVGFKRAYELYPKPLLTRIKKERRRRFEEEHHALVVRAQAELNARDGSGKSGNGDDEEAGLQQEAELRARVDALRRLLDEYEDAGPLLDVVHWHDGAEWKAVLGEAGDWSERWPMGDYARFGEFDQFGEADLLSYSFKFYEAGDVVSVVVCSGSHGTHVGAITAAYHPPAGAEGKEDPVSGVAPGAQLISLKIGDTRLGSMETGAALVRALVECVRLGVDVMNISYGEDADVPNRGQVIELMRKVVHEHNITVVSSAGNAGPALSTVGAPGGTTSGVISVGAYVSDAMMRAEYNLLESVGETTYTWCSRGPTLDGDRGVTVYAPGAAVTSVPQYCLQNAQLMNGTSMSSPSACGGIALVISALKQQGIAYTPHRLRKAVDFSARSVGDPLGVGFLQVCKLHAHLVAHAETADADVDFGFKVLRAGMPAAGQEPRRGVYLREAHETAGVQDLSVELKPELRECETRKKWALDLRLQLQVVPAAAAAWVRVPQFVSLGAEGRTFDIRVDASALAPGLHFAEMVAFDTRAPGRVVCKMPVTVAKPVPQETTAFAGMAFGPGEVKRTFIAVPEGATSAQIKFRSGKHESPVKLVAHITQLLPHTKHSANEQYYVFSLAAGEPVLRRFAVAGGVAMEVCLSQFWNSLGTMELEFNVVFGGLQLLGGNGELALHSGELTRQLTFASALRPEELRPKLKFDCWRRTLRPVDAVVSPLRSRDVLPDSRQVFQLVLEYKHKHGESALAEVSYALQPLAGNMYDASVGMLSAAFDAQGKLLAFGDVNTKKLKIQRGELTVKVQLRHESPAVLERFKHAPLVLTTFGGGVDKASAAGFDFYADHLFVGEADAKPVKSARLRRGDRLALVLNVPALEAKAWPPGAAAGDVLVGQLALNDGARIRPDAGEVAVTYVLPPKELPLKSHGAAGKKGAADKDGESLPDLQLELAKKVASKEERLQYLDSLAPLPRDAREELRYRVALVDCLAELLETPPSQKAAADAATVVQESSSTPPSAAATAVMDKTELQARLENVITAQLLPLVDAGEVLRVQAARQLPAEQQSKETKALLKHNGEQRDALVKAWTQLAHIALVDGRGEGADAALRSLRDFVDFGADLKAGILFAEREIACGRMGGALKVLHKLIADNGDKASDDAYKRAKRLVADAFARLQWTPWARHAENWQLIDAPPAKFLF